MDLTIYDYFNSSTNMRLYVTDKMNTVKSKNRILFEIARLDVNMKKIYSVVFFMEILDAKLLCYKLLSDKLSPSDLLSLVRGKHGDARAITVSKVDQSLNIKIDNGTGAVRDNGFTEFNEKTGYGYVKLNNDESLKLCIALKDRIFQRELLFLSN